MQIWRPTGSLSVHFGRWTPGFYWLKLRPPGGCDSHLFEPFCQKLPLDGDKISIESRTRFLLDTIVSVPFDDSYRNWILNFEWINVKSPRWDLSAKMPKLAARCRWNKFELFCFFDSGRSESAEQPGVPCQAGGPAHRPRIVAPPAQRVEFRFRRIERHWIVGRILFRFRCQSEEFEHVRRRRRQQRNAHAVDSVEQLQWRP